MNILKPLLLFISAGLLITACNSQNSKIKQIKEEKKDVFKITINDKRDDSILNLSSITDSVEYIYLETLPDNLIGELSEVKMYKNLIIVFDRTFSQKVFIFSRDGKFINSIGEKGRGPGEFKKIWAWSINEWNDELYILDDGNRKVSVFDLQGHMIREFQLGSLYSVFFSVVGPNSLAFLPVYNPANKELKYEVLFTDTLGVVKGAAMKFDDYLDQATYFVPAFPFFKSSSANYFYNAQNYRIYEISDSAVTQFATVDFGNLNLPEKFLTKEYNEKRNALVEVGRGNNFVSAMDNVKMTKNSVAFNYSRTIDSYLRFAIFSSKNNEVHIGRSIVNDLDDIIISARVVGSDDESLYFGVYPQSIKYRINELKEENKEVGKALSEMRNKVSDNDNPVIARIITR